MTVEEYLKLLEKSNLAHEEKIVLAKQFQLHEGPTVQFSWQDMDLPFQTSAKLEVWPTIMRPHITGSSRACCQFIKDNPELFRNKRIVDVGTGCGILGITAYMMDAKNVFLGDICPTAVDNASTNIDRLGLKQVKIFGGDLLEEFDGDADIAIFNHPFFCGNAIPSLPISMSMMAPRGIVTRFFKQARERNIPRVIMPFWQKAGSGNDPYHSWTESGFELVDDRFYTNQIGEQLGEVYVHEFMIK